MPLVYLNGELVEEADAKISVFDHGLVTGDGVFESVVVRRGRPFALRRHLARLGRSAAAIGLEAPPSQELAAAVEEVVAAAGFEFGKIRLTVTGGLGPLGSGRAKSCPTVVVAVEQLAEPSPSVAVVVVPWARNDKGALSGAKTISYAENVVALAYAREKGAEEALFLNTAGELCEGSGTNVFLGIEGELVTPPLSAGCLAGVTRSLVMESVAVTERRLPRRELERAEELFLTSTTRGVHPVREIDGRPLSWPGPLTSQAARAFGALIRAGQA